MIEKHIPAMKVASLNRGVSIKYGSVATGRSLNMFLQLTIK